MEFDNNFFTACQKVWYHEFMHDLKSSENIFLQNIVHPACVFIKLSITPVFCHRLMKFDDILSISSRQNETQLSLTYTVTFVPKWDIFNIQWNLTYPDLTYPDLTYPDYSLIWTLVWVLIPIPKQKVTPLSVNSVIRTVSLGTEVSIVYYHNWFPNMCPDNWIIRISGGRLSEASL